MSESRPLKSILYEKENSKDKNFLNVPESVRKALNQAARNEANAKEIAAEFERQQKGQAEQLASEQSEKDAAYEEDMKQVFEQLERQGKQKQALEQEMDYQRNQGREFAGFSFNDDVPSTPMPGGRRKSRKHSKHRKHSKTSKKTRRFRKIRVL